MPDDTAVEKQHELEVRGASVECVRPVAISHPQHMVHQARKAASAAPPEASLASAPDSSMDGGFFADQFENLDNAEAHMETGEEIWIQSGGRVHAFVCGAGTGGTIAGVSLALKKRSKDVKIILADPQGSSLYLKVCLVLFGLLRCYQHMCTDGFNVELLKNTARKFCVVGEAWSSVQYCRSRGAPQAKPFRHSH